MRRSAVNQIRKILLRRKRLVFPVKREKCGNLNNCSLKKAGRNGRPMHPSGMYVDLDSFFSPHSLAGSVKDKGIPCRESSEKQLYEETGRICW